MNRIFTSLFILFIVAGCKKDPPTTIPCGTCDDCPPHRYSPSLHGWQNVTLGIPFNKPCFNPNNANEFLFTVSDSGSTKIYKHNYINHTTDFIFSATSFNSAPQWGPNDWVVMAMNASRIWKIKSNGDSLTQLTFSGYYYYPKWTYDGNIAAYTIFSPATHIPAIIFNPDGQIIDTISSCQFNEWVDWNNPNYAVRAGCGVELYNKSNGTCELLVDVYSAYHACVGFATFAGSNKIVWTKYKGMYLTDINTKQTTAIRTHCDTTSYYYPSYSWLANKLIWAKLTSTPDVANNIMYGKSVIVMMNADGTNEQEIDIQF